MFCFKNLRKETIQEKYFNMIEIKKASSFEEAFLLNIS